MKDALPALRRTNRAFILLAALAQFALVLPAYALSVPNDECTRAFNRVTSLMPQNPIELCGRQQQVLDALDAAAVPCAGMNIGAMKSDLLNSARGCPTGGGAQGGGDGSRRSSSSAAAAGNSARERADGDQAEQYMEEMKKCDQRPDPGSRATCRKVTTQNYQSNGSGSGSNANSSASGSGSASNNLDEKSGQQPKALPPPKDPDVDYRGKSCAYFTKPAQDEHGLNYYAKGSCVSYGKSSYECDADGRWQFKGPVWAIRCEPEEEAERSGYSPSLGGPGS